MLTPTATPNRVFILELGVCVEGANSVLLSAIIYGEKRQKENIQNIKTKQDKKVIVIKREN